MGEDLSETDYETYLEIHRAELTVKSHLTILCFIAGLEKTELLTGILGAGVFGEVVVAAADDIGGSS